MKMKNILRNGTAILLMALGTVSCKKDETVTAPSLDSKTFNYAFNTGQIDASFAYDGQHASNLAGDLKLEEQENGKTKITFTLNNTVNGETYNIHAHDAADASTTPNGTPYNETPNGDVFVQQIMGNGGSVSTSTISSKTFKELTTSYSGFFVIHDPLQGISTTNPKTFVILGLFAR
jgi:hypothetical protein